MYKCPNCGGNLKFDISSQQLICRHCSTQLDPYSVGENLNAVEKDFYEATVFTCPQCGGELLSADNESTSFCSYCGTSAMLDSRISKGKRPAYIIPFCKTKEDCKKAYSKMMRKAVFAPKELKDEKYLEGFRGIYIPYWYYHITQKGPVMLEGTNDFYSPSTITTNHYHITFQLDASYNGLIYNASPAFAQNSSIAITPYDLTGMKKFTPAFLSGLYAETAEIPYSLYKNKAVELATLATYNELRPLPPFQSFDVDFSALSLKFHNQFQSINSILLPIWFLSYQKNGRVAYALVNGQTGKAISNLPIDFKKYALGSLLLALPIFVLLNLFFTIHPPLLLILAAALAFLSLFLHRSELLHIIREEAEPDIAETSSGDKPKRHFSFYLAMLFYILCIVLLITIFYFIHPASLWVFAFMGGTIATGMTCFTLRKLPIQKKRFGFFGSFVAMLFLSIVGILRPVSDWFYYAGASLAILAICFTVSDLIYYHNILVTRKLPQFTRPGGEDNA